MITRPRPGPRRPGRASAGQTRVALMAAGVTMSGAFLTAYRRWHQRWGATDEEVAMALPGDDLLPVAEFNPTRAITIDARPEEVWPWIVQIGYGRAGFYAYDLLDNLGRPSAERILPELQAPQVGDWIPMSPTINDTTAFRVTAFEPDRWMLWSKPDSTWCWSLRPIADGRTRLVSRIRMKYAWRTPAVLVSLFLMEIGDFFMNRRELLGIRRRAEALAARRGPASTVARPVAVAAA